MKEIFVPVQHEGGLAKGFVVTGESFFAPADDDFVVIPLTSVPEGIEGMLEVGDRLHLRYLDGEQGEITSAWYMVSSLLRRGGAILAEKYILRRMSGGEVGRLVPLHTMVANFGQYTGEKSLILRRATNRELFTLPPSHAKMKLTK